MTSDAKSGVAIVCFAVTYVLLGQGREGGAGHARDAVGGRKLEIETMGWFRMEIWGDRIEICLLRKGAFKADSLWLWILSR